MAKIKQPRSPEAADASLLPGYGWEATTMTPPVKGASSDGPPLRWWVRTSATQVISPKSGQPLGFKHTLMNGNKVVCSGVGADAGRTLQTQAEFMNSREAAGAVRSALQRNAGTRIAVGNSPPADPWKRDPSEARRRAKRASRDTGQERPQGWLRKQPGEAPTAASSSRWRLRPSPALPHSPL
jgi:hypothetical protein